MNLKFRDIRKNTIKVLSGTILTEDFFLKNTRFMLVVFVIVVLYISNRYSCIAKKAEIESLKSEMKDVKYQSLSISSELTSLSRQSKVQTLVDKNDLGLKASTKPAYKISGKK